MSPFLASILAGLGISLLAFIGFWTLSLEKKRLAKWLAVIVAFSAGALLGGAFFHLLPESVERGGPTFALALIGIISFFLIDTFIWLYHCHGGHRLHEHGHEHECPVKPVGILNLIGDAIHNITDGVIVASAFLVSIPLGITTAVAVALHEIPQEVSDFGILLHSGYSQKKALKWNFLVALTILIGIVGTFIAVDFVETLTLYTVPFAAGGFIYIAATNLLPEIKEEESTKKRAIQFLFLLFGVILLYLMKLWLDG